ncbi:MAG: hypothetical protein KC733_07340 [Candidatus Omnitrophica bacterium]|nr:hypothetical protein [Candidatus Omnitrophota bacterium]
MNFQGKPFIIGSTNLLEIPAFHQYVEVKATRDIYIHNQGIANQIYIEKSASHARVKKGAGLPITVDYFLQAYESCLQINEYLRESLHEKWPSSEYEASKETTTATPKT